MFALAGETAYGSFAWPHLNKYLENEIYLYCMLVSSFIARVL
jgi:hypothetical protein